jgi:hypothetical protein
LALASPTAARAGPSRSSWATGNGGHTALYAGDSSEGDGGTINLFACEGTTGAGGDLAFVAGPGSPDGGVYVSSGPGLRSSSGRLILKTANAVLRGESGPIAIRTGTTTNSGSLVLSTGTAGGGNGGSISVVADKGERRTGGGVTLIAGDSATATGRDVDVRSGAGEETSSGSITLATANAGFELDSSAGTPYVFPSGTNLLGAGEYLVVCQDVLGFEIDKGMMTDPPLAICACSLLLF